MGQSNSLLFERANENRSGQSSTLDYRWSREHRYDAQENETDLFSYEQGILEAHRVWTYDYRGRLISSQVIVSDPAKDQQVYGLCADCGLSSGRSVYKYDKNSRIREERVFQAGDRLVSLNRYSYDSHGNRTREWVYQFGSPESGQRKTVLKLDGVRRVATSTNGLPKSAFSYDSHGNWIKKVSTRLTNSPDASGRITLVTHRSIHYY